MQDTLEVFLAHHKKVAVCDTSDGYFPGLLADQGEFSSHAAWSKRCNLGSKVSPLHECAFALEGAESIPVDSTVSPLRIEATLRLLPRCLILIRNEELIRLNVLPTWAYEVRRDHVHAALSADKHITVFTGVSLPEDHLLRRCITELSHLCNAFKSSSAFLLHFLKELQGAQQAHRPQDMLKVFLLYHKEVAISDANHCASTRFSIQQGNLPKHTSFTQVAHVPTVICIMTIHALAIQCLVRRIALPLRFC
mmetsp:Transcript_5808/g.13820  ORF Transcript_5808/g.13820 Transcript_5808/m.13820 type:complete len:251 (-) Transcript_5808:939-1691(-)